jgi:hypothetical protein
MVYEGKSAEAKHEMEELAGDVFSGQEVWKSQNVKWECIIGNGSSLATRRCTRVVTASQDGNRMLA